MIPSRFRIPLVAVLVAIGLASGIAVQVNGAPEAPQWRNLTAEEGRTLLSLARDFHPEEEEARYLQCMQRVDAAAADPEQKAQMQEALSLAVGGVRRMGYTSYADITDDYERRRLAKMLAEGQWMRGFRKGLGECLSRGTPQ
jgi:hypothetical protein